MLRAFDDSQDRPFDIDAFDRKPVHDKRPWDADRHPLQSLGCIWIASSTVLHDWQPIAAIIYSARVCDGGPSQVSDRVVAKVESSRFPFVGPRWSRTRSPPPDAQDQPSLDTACEIAVGFPMHALRCMVDPQTIEGGITVSLPFGKHRTWASVIRGSPRLVLPSRPILPGFLVNVVLLGVAGDWLWTFGVRPVGVAATRGVSGVWRRQLGRRRLRRGLCPHCAYPMDKSRPADAVCPECGKAPTPARKKAAKDSDMPHK